MKDILRPRWGPLLASLMVTAVLAVPAAYLLVPHLHRAWRLHGLDSDDPVRRARSLDHLAREAAGDPRLARAAAGRMRGIGADRFDQLREALDRAGQWRRPTIPPDIWLRWLQLLAAESSPEARILAAHRSLDLGESGTDPDALALLCRLLQDPHADVRYNALVSAAAQAATAGAAPFEPLLARAAGDREPAIAAQAWMMVGLLGAKVAPEPGWMDGDGAVSAAALWALVRSRPDQPDMAIAILEDPARPPALRAAAAAALALCPEAVATGPLVRLLASGPAAVTPATLTLFQRAALAVPVDPDRPDAVLEAVLAALGDGWPDPATVACHPEPLLNALHSRPTGRRLREAPRIARSWRDHPLLTLATLEGLPPGRVLIPPDPPPPDIIRLAAVAATADPSPEPLARLFRQDEPTLRDSACIVAAQRLAREDLVALTHTLLHDYNDTTRISGAILAGLCNEHRQRLADSARAERRWLLRQMHRLALWMQGAEEDDTALPIALLGRSDVPRSTVLLALLHRAPATALDHLLNPLGEPEADLRDLLVHHRWWYVLRRYLPPGAPQLWLWADEPLQQFQIEVLRNWWLLRRAGYRSEAASPSSGPPRL